MGSAGVIFHADGVTNIETKTRAINAHTYQHEFCAQSDKGPATVHLHKNLLEPGQESLSNGI